MSAASLPDPRNASWESWATAVVVTLLPSYNLPNPGPEGLWQAWAAELLNISGLAATGVPDPRAYGGDWRRWAVAFVFTQQ